MLNKKTIKRNEKLVERPKQVHCVCAHCGDIYGGNSGRCAEHCKNCRTAAGRKAIDDANAQIDLERAKS